MVLSSLVGCRNEYEPLSGFLRSKGFNMFNAETPVRIAVLLVASATRSDGYVCQSSTVAALGLAVSHSGKTPS
jgi:hypothetical protein